MGIAFAAAIAGRLHAHQARILPILHVTDQLAVLDQHVAVGRRAFIVDRKRAAAFRDRAVIDDRNTLGSHLLAKKPGECGGFLAIEIAFQPVTHCFMQHHARPASGEHDVECACGRRVRLKIDQRLPQSLVGCKLPAVLRNKLAKALAASHAVGAAFLTVAIADHDRNVHPHQRTNILQGHALGAHDLDMLPGGSERGRHLPHARVGTAQIGVNLGQQLHLFFKAGCRDRVVLAIEMPVGAGRPFCECTCMAGLHRRHCVGSTFQRRFRKLRCMRIANRFAGNGAQPKSLLGVEAAGFQPAIVEHQGFALAVFDEELAVIRTVDRVVHDRANGVFGNVELVEKPVGHAALHV